MAKVVWTDRAGADLISVRAYIGQFNPLAAQRVAAKLLAAGEALSDFPEQGRPSGRGRRELTTVPPYLIRYRIKGDMVEILTIRHGARRPS